MSLVAQLCPTLCDPMDRILPGSSVHGILQARILERVAMPFSRESSWHRDWTRVSCVAGRFFTVWATMEATRWSGWDWLSSVFCRWCRHIQETGSVHWKVWGLGTWAGPNSTRPSPPKILPSLRYQEPPYTEVTLTTTCYCLLKMQHFSFLLLNVKWVSVQSGRK